MTKFNVETATEQEMREHVETTMRAQNHNCVAKTKLIADLRFALKDDGQTQYQARIHRDGYASESNRLTPEQAGAWKTFFSVRLQWLEANPGDDLTPEVVARYVRFALALLPELMSLRAALGYIIDADEYSPGYAPGEVPMKKTPTHEKVEKVFRRVLEEASGWLVDTVTVESLPLLRELSQVHIRRTQKFWLHRPLGTHTRGFDLIEIDIKPRQASWPYWHATFEKCVGEAVSLKQIKQLCGIWHVPVTVKNILGQSVVVSDERTAGGRPTFYICGRADLVAVEKELP